MNNSRVVKSSVSDHDRFGMTFFLAVVFHGIVILGVTFTVSPPVDNKTAPLLDIILVQTRSPVEVDNPDYLAQVSQQGGGNAQEKARPKELFTAPTLAEKPGIASQTEEARIQKQKQAEKLALLTAEETEHDINTEINIDKSDANNQEEITEVTRNTQIARMAAEINHTIVEEASLNRTKYLNSSTKEFTPAQYMREWVSRVERVGNLNYPDQARRKKLSGTLILDVVINADGKLLKTDLRQSSGHQILDDAARRIVKLAAPFSAFPPKLRKEADVIHITRSWEFLDNSSIRTH